MKADIKTFEGYMVLRGCDPNENECRKSLKQRFSTSFVSRHTSLVEEQFGGKHNYNLQVNKRQVQRLVAPLELSTAPKGSAAHRLRPTVSKDN